MPSAATTVDPVATTRFSGRAFSARELTLVRDVVRNCSGLSRMELARTVCELLRWRRPNGGLKARECREFLERLDAEGAVVLPNKRRGRAVGSVTRVPRTAAGEPGRPLSGSVRDVEPLDVELVCEPAQRLVFRELLGRYHYLGHTVPFGAHLRYLVFASRPARAVVGCLQFSSPAWRMAVRDRWVGWDESARVRNLQRVVNNSRFLLLPWVRVAKRVWASVEREPVDVVAEATLEAERRDPEHGKHWVALVDGAETQLALVEEAAAARGVDVTVILDIIHVVEYVWKAAHAFHPAGSPELACWAWTRVGRILEGRARTVAASMRGAATVAGLSPDARKPVDTCADYLRKYAPYLHYDRYLAAGYPIATGVIEGACRYLVRDRMELTGARWRLAGAEAVLKLRALRASGDFDAYWEFHEAREYERNHAEHYADRTPPPVTEPPEPPSPPRLRRVK